MRLREFCFSYFKSHLAPYKFVYMMSYIKYHWSRILQTFQSSTYDWVFSPLHFYISNLKMSEREIFMTGLIFMSRQFRKVSRQSVEFLGANLPQACNYIFLKIFWKCGKLQVFCKISLLFIVVETTILLMPSDRIEWMMIGQTFPHSVFIHSM